MQLQVGGDTTILGSKGTVTLKPGAGLKVCKKLLTKA